MAKLAKLNNSLLRSVSRAALGADAPAEDENDVAENEDEDTAPPAGRRGRKAKKATRRSRRAQDDDETAEDDEETAEDDDDLDAEDEDPDAEDDLDPDAEDDDLDAEDDDETAEGEDDDLDAEDEDDVPPAGRRGRKSKKAKAAGRGGRSANSGERARIAAITRSKLAAGREGLAEYLAFDTGLGARTALGILKHAPKARNATTLRSRMASVDNPRIKATARGQEVSDEDRVVQSAVKTTQQFGF